MILAPASLAWAQACFPYRPLPPAGLTPGRDARLSADVPFAVTPGTPVESRDGAVCRATRAEGRVRTAARDTIHFETLSRVVPAMRGDPACRWAGGAAVAVLPDEGAPRATERRFSAGRTALLVGGIAAVGVGILAYIASTIQFDFSSGQGCASLCWQAP
jgi:hypothetical protein